MMGDISLFPISYHLSQLDHLSQLEAYCGSKKDRNRVGLVHVGRACDLFPCGNVGVAAAWTLESFLHRRPNRNGTPALGCDAFSKSSSCFVTGGVVRGLRL